MQTTLTFTIQQFALYTITCLVSIVSFFAIRTLNKIDNNQTELFHKIDELNTRLSMLEGEHAVVQGRCRTLLERLEHISK